MISRLSGIILEKDSASILIDVRGVGYEVHLSLNSLFDAPNVGESVTLHTHFVVREDAHQLFGFTKLQERDLFRLLIKINGVGPKMAIAVLSGVSYDEFIRCVSRLYDRIPDVVRMLDPRAPSFAFFCEALANRNLKFTVDDDKARHILEDW